MKSAQLEKLEKLTGKRVEQTRRQLDAESAKLIQLDSHCAELTSVNKEYQRSLIGSRVAPQYLSLQRGFVEKLSVRIEQIVNAREEKAKLVQAISEEHVHRSAQHAAIEIVSKQKLEEIATQIALYEQQQMDDAARQQFINSTSEQQGQDND